MWPGMIPIMAFPALITPAQFGPMSRVRRSLAWKVPLSPVRPWMMTGVFSSSRMLMTSVPHRHLLGERFVAGRDDPVRGVCQRFGGDDREAAVAQDAASFLDIRAGESNDERHPDRDLPHRLHHTLRHPVAAVDAGEHIHE